MMTIDDAQIQGCKTCGYYIPNHVPGEGDCMYPCPRGCTAKNGWPFWVAESVPEFALEYIRKKQSRAHEAEVRAERFETECERLRLDRHEWKVRWACNERGWLKFPNERDIQMARAEKAKADLAAANKRLEELEEVSAAHHSLLTELWDGVRKHGLNGNIGQRDGERLIHAYCGGIVTVMNERDDLAADLARLRPVYEAVRPIVRLWQDRAAHGGSDLRSPDARALCEAFDRAEKTEEGK